MNLGLHAKPWLRRAAFLATTASMLTAAMMLVGLPIHDLFADRAARIAEQRGLLARLAAVAAQGPTVEALARQADTEINRAAFLSGANEGVISADLQTRLKTMAAGSRARIHSIQGLPTRTEGRIKYVGARIDLTGSLQAVQRLVYAIEAGKPYLFITTGVLRPSLAAGRPVPTVEPTIDAQLELFGAVDPDGAAR